MATYQPDFFGEGTVDQGTAAPLSLAEQAEMEDNRRRRELEEDRSRRLAGLSSTPLDTNGVRGTAASNARVQQDRIDRGFDPFKGDQRGIFSHLAEDPVTTGVLLAPLAVTGAGAAMGGLSAAGTTYGGTALAGSAGQAAGIPAMGAPATMASPFAAAPAGVPAMGAPAMMASPFAASAGGGGAAAGTGAAGAAASGAWTAKDYLSTFLPLASSLGLAGLDELMHGGQSKADKALIEKQEQMAREAELRREQTNNARMDALGQRMLAYNPHNQLMASMFGPDAAFSQTQFADMVHNPMQPQLDPSLEGYQGTDPKKSQQINDYMAADARYKASEEARRGQMMSGMSPVPQGPAPMQMAAPQAARRY